MEGCKEAPFFVGQKRRRPLNSLSKRTLQFLQLIIDSLLATTAEDCKHFLCPVPASEGDNERSAKEAHIVNSVVLSKP